jgi:hypothetical protein
MNLSIFKSIKLIATSSSAINGATKSLSGTIYSTGLPRVNAGSSELHTLLSITFGILGAISVLIIVISGMRFVLSEGKPENAARARETIIYAVVGLIISISAELIVAFVLNKVG